jgi:GT2 family glycosyltransferase/polysaccharide pyruvyl transferase WcaK-like protein
MGPNSESGDGRRNPFQDDVELLYASPLFDAPWYLSQNPDVALAAMDPAEHYLRFGGGEGRDPGPKFSSTDYFYGNPDVQDAGINPLLHYIQCGEGEGRLISSLHEQWMEKNDRLDATDRTAIQEHIASLKWRPFISIIVPVYRTNPNHLQQMLASVKKQSYSHWECCLADDNSPDPHTHEILKEAAAPDPRFRLAFRTANGNICAATSTALDLASGEFVCFLDHDDLLHENALYEVAVALNAQPDADIIYSDSDCIDDEGRRFNPYFKTSWNYDLMLGHNMISHLGVYRRSLVEDSGRLRLGYEGSQDYDLTLRVAEATDPSRILHIPAILYHWRRSRVHPSFSTQSLERCVRAARAAVADHLQRRGIQAIVEPCPRMPNFNRVAYAIPAPPPLVTVGIVATGDPDDLIQCLSDVLFRTAYEPIEVLLVQPSFDPELASPFLRRLERDGLARILHLKEPADPVRARNLAVREARGEVVILLNGDLRMSDPGWMTELVSHALRPGVGLVGPLIVGSDGRIANAGVVLGALPQVSSVKSDSFGYHGIFALTREVSALASACLAFRRSVYLSNDGLSEERAPHASEIEFCLRVREAGFRNILTPHATVACSKPVCDNRVAGRRQVNEPIPEDPFYNPNLSLDQLFSQASNTSRRVKPWFEIRKRILSREKYGRRVHARTAGAARPLESVAGIAGTFDVENYGDLLFPLIASAALSRRNRNIRVQPFSVNAKSSDNWPFQVERLEDLTASVSTLSAMLIGGGQIVRFDKFYPVPAPASADLPLAYWLTPAVLAALTGKPVIWNAVGAWTDSPPAHRHHELIRKVFEASYFIGVRDHVSIDHLSGIAPEAMIELLPDTAFSLSRLWPLEEESAEFTDWRMSLSLPHNYVVIQASAAVENHQARIDALLDSMGQVNAVVLPVCWCHGDRAEHFERFSGKMRLSRTWLSPRLIAEILGRAQFVFASSMHACITALSYGVPVARVDVSKDRKYELLSEFEGIAHLDDDEALTRILRRGRCLEPRVIEHADRLERYWDEVADVVLHPPEEHGKFSRSIMLRWVAQTCGDRLSGTYRNTLLKQLN